ncbi:MAG: phosphoribosylformylglycinamidine synthase subunit PurS [Elusimicrobium sp.]|jgi:phosphoribosylformylglycinamidine (FGAM) synthase PurS component|nr:phosphoribosylformylglycinamidine synthase subunit PurS [Elusimicrobium sp.]
MKYFVAVYHKLGYGAHKENGIKKRLQSVGLKDILEVKSYAIYQIDGDYAPAQAENIAKALLADPVLETYAVNPPAPQNVFKVEVWIRDSSTDVVGESVVDAIETLGFKRPQSVRVANAFNIDGKFSEAALETAVKKTFVNEVVNKFSIRKY